MDRPWENADTWPRTVRSDARRAAIAMSMFAVFWNLVAWPVATVIPRELAAGNHLVLAALLFPLTGLYLCVLAWRRVQAWRRYGITALWLDPYPGAIGGHVGGILDLSQARIDAGETFEVALECVHSYVSGSGKNRSRREDVRWQASGAGELLHDGSAIKLAFRFDVPAGLPSSEPQEGGSYDYWRVRVRSDQASMAFDRTFEIGVFATAELSQHVSVDTTARGREDARETLDGAMVDPGQAQDLRAQHGLSVERRGDWLRLYLHRGRQRGMAMVVGLVGIVFAGVMVFLPDEGLTTTILRVVFGFFGFVLIALAAYLPFNSLDVRISKREISWIRTWFGLVVDRRKISPRDIQTLEIAKGSSSTDASGTTIYYRLTGKGAFGTFRLLESISDRALVEALREQVMAAAGLSRSSLG